MNRRYYKTMADVIADAKTKPGLLGIATPGVGGIQQMQFEWVASVAGIRLQHIPFKGGAPAAAVAPAVAAPASTVSVIRPPSATAAPVARSPSRTPPGGSAAGGPAN